MALTPCSEVRISTAISFGSVFGPRTATEVAAGDSGYEDRRVLWSQHRFVGDIRYGIRTFAQLQELSAFFRCCRGMARGWRFKWHVSYLAVDELLAVGDGVLTTCQLLKWYPSGIDSHAKVITKPVGIGYPVGNTYDSVTFKLDGVPQDPGTIGLHYATGVVTLPGPLASGAQLTWSGEFDIPVRFGSDHLPLNLINVLYGGTSDAVPIIELLPDVVFPAELATLATVG